MATKLVCALIYADGDVRHHPAFVEIPLNHKVWQLSNQLAAKAAAEEGVQPSRVILWKVRPSHTSR